MDSQKKRIGIYGGSFNPLHVGHVAIARRVIATGLCDEVWMMVSPLNPLKKDATDILPDDVRFSLVRKGVSRLRGVKASDYEFHLPRPSYTWDTLQHLQEDFPDFTFVLIIGADNWEAFPRWKRHEDLLEGYDIIVYPREGISLRQADLPPRVTLIDMPLMNVSSTEIRRRLAEGESIAGMVPRAIEEKLKRLKVEKFKK